MNRLVTLIALSAAAITINITVNAIESTDQSHKKGNETIKATSNPPVVSASKIASVPISQTKVKGFDVDSEFEHLSKRAPSINPKVLKLALTAYSTAKHDGKLKKPYMTVIDYSMPSSKKRMWVFDMSHDKLVYNILVAHGKNTGNLYAKHFSNRPSSKESSLGTYVTDNAYIGSKGYALNLKGLEKGFNDNAYSRRIVIHGAWYANKSFVNKYGRVGRSWGCPAVPKKLAKPLISKIKGGSLVFAYYPDKKWLTKSHYLTA